MSSPSLEPVRVETKTVRPFSGLSALETLFAQVALFAGDQVCQPAPGQMVLEGPALTTAELRIELGFDEEALRHALEPTGLVSDDLALLVTARARTYNVARILQRYEFGSEPLPALIGLDRAAADLVFGDRNGFDLRVALLLARPQRPAPLRPSRPGTWLAKQDFHLRPEQVFSGFSLHPMTDEDRKRLGAPPQCLTWLEIEDGFEHADDLGGAVVQYIDDETLGFLQASPTNPWALQLQTRLAVDLLCGLVESTAAVVASDGGSASEEWVAERPALGRFLERLSGEIGLTPESLVARAAESPQEARALIEDLVGLRSATTKALREE